MDSSILAFMAAHHIRDRVEEATAARTAREVRRGRKRRAGRPGPQGPGHNIGALTAYGVHARAAERR
jgi:hypothetical protein